MCLGCTGLVAKAHNYLGTSLSSKQVLPIVLGEWKLKSNYMHMCQLSSNSTWNIKPHTGKRTNSFVQVCHPAVPQIAYFNCFLPLLPPSFLSSLVAMPKALLIQWGAMNHALGAGLLTIKVSQDTGKDQSLVALDNSHTIKRFHEFSNRTDHFAPIEGLQNDLLTVD